MEHRINPRPVCKFEFACCGPVEKKLERSICLGLVVTARQSSLGSKIQKSLKQALINKLGMISKTVHDSKTLYEGTFILVKK